MSRFRSLTVSSPLATTFFMIVLNLLIFIGLPSSTSFRMAHHHWIFPFLSLVFLIEWMSFVGLAYWKIPIPRVDRRAGRITVLFTIGFLLIMGLVRHQTVLTCFDRCGIKLALASLVGGVVFFGQAWQNDTGFWNKVRSQFTGLGCLIWAGYLVLENVGLTSWINDLVLICIGLLLWLGRRCRARFAIAVAIPGFLLIRETENEWLIIFLSLTFIGFLFWMSRNWTEPMFSGGRSPNKSISSKISHGLLRIGLTVGLLVGLFIFLSGPITHNVDPQARRKTLRRWEATKKRPMTVNDLSPLAQRLRHHVKWLSDEIGERAVYDAAALEKTQTYLTSVFEEAGHHPRRHDFQSKNLPLVVDGRTYANIDVVLGGSAPGAPFWVVGAHYDTAPGTKGADDNASGVAVLLELARLLKEERLSRDVRLVAFANEEPPSFGTQNMGSAHYARELNNQNAKLKGMISLEMLGYFNDQAGSQLYPPFLHLFFPNKGNFISLVSNFKSRGLLKEVKQRWKAASAFPLETVALPGPFSTVALSDQLNFWSVGFPALMLSDTSFYRNPHYHQASDTFETLDYERMAEITHALVAVLKE